MIDLPKASESLYMENQLLNQNVMRQPDALSVDTAGISDIIGYNYKHNSLVNTICPGSYSLVNPDDEIDKTSVLKQQWEEKHDDMIDPTDKDFCRSKLINKKMSKCSAMKYRFWMNDGKDYINVSKSIVFSKRDSQCGFQGKIVITNDSNDDITYRVASSALDKFRYFPDDIGWIAPGSSVEILVQTNRLNAVNFEDVITETFFVQATPIYYKEQLDMRALNILWKAYGTEMFPGELLEEHLIKDIHPLESEYLGAISMMEQLRFAFFKSIKDIELAPATCSERSFYEHWPMPSQSSIVEAQKERTAEMLESIEDIEKEQSKISKKALSKLTFIAFAIAGFTAVTCTLMFNPGDLYGQVCSAFRKFKRQK